MHNQNAKTWNVKRFMNEEVLKRRNGQNAKTLKRTHQNVKTRNAETSKRSKRQTSKLKCETSKRAWAHLTLKRLGLQNAETSLSKKLKRQNAETSKRWDAETAKRWNAETQTWNVRNAPKRHSKYTNL